MNHTRLFTLSATILLAGAALGACSDSGTNVTASFFGEVELLAENGSAFPTAEGVTVSVSGPGGVQTRVTGEDGAFSFSDLEPGIYDLDFSKPGFGNQKANRIRLGNVEGQASLPELSSIEILALELSPRLCGDAPCLDMVIKTRNAFPEGITRRIFRAFIGTVGRLSTTDYPEMLPLVVPSDDPGISVVADTTIFSLQGVTSFYMGQLPPDVELRMLLYGSTENASATYRDPISGLTVFPDLSTTFADEQFTNP